MLSLDFHVEGPKLHRKVTATAPNPLASATSPNQPTCLNRVKFLFLESEICSRRSIDQVGNHRMDLRVIPQTMNSRSIDSRYSPQLLLISDCKLVLSMNSSSISMAPFYLQSFSVSPHN